MKEKRPSVLLSTMGGQAQVVTFALDVLLAQGEEIEQVVVLHLSPDDPRVHRALAQLGQVFAADFYAHAGRACHFRHVLIRDSDRPLVDIRSEADATATWRVVHEVISTLKAQGWQVHLCLAGGRRMIGLLALSVAMLIFEHHDRVWHMYTPRDLLERARDGAILHARPEDGVRLIQVPIVPWGAYFPALRALAQASPLEAVAAQVQWMDAEERARCQRAIGQLTSRQVEVLRAFAAGQDPQQVAETLCVTVKTVHAHKTVILDECRNAWGLPEGTRLDYHFLREKFGRYFGP